MGNFIFDKRHMRLDYRLLRSSGLRSPHLISVAASRCLLSHPVRPQPCTSNRPGQHLLVSVHPLPKDPGTHLSALPLGHNPNCSLEPSKPITVRPLAVPCHLFPNSPSPPHGSCLTILQMCYGVSQLYLLIAHTLTAGLACAWNSARSWE